jgi:SAM-dependent methyltransferase
MSSLTSEPFWSEHQPGFRFSKNEPGTAAFFADVEHHRYRLESHIQEIVQFSTWRNRDVLEVGCGIATDGVNFARAGARYTGVDQSASALALARRRFGLEQLDADFVESQACPLPFADSSFDLVFSHGVLHHLQTPEDAVKDFHRVLRPGGTALAMVYNRNSLNYWFTIMLARRLLVAALLIPGVPKLVADIAGEEPWVLMAHRRLLQRHGLRYLWDKALFLSNNTDGPGNPLSRVYSRRHGAQLFRIFDEVLTDARFLNLRTYPGGQKFAPTRVARLLERRLGWHLYVRALKAPSTTLPQAIQETWGAAHAQARQRTVIKGRASRLTPEATVQGTVT